MSISNATIHNVRLDSHFTITSNKTPEAPNLSWAAKGLLWYILSRPQDWVVKPVQLANIYEGGARGGGIKSIWTLLKELRKSGFVKYSKSKDSKGHWQHRYDVYPIPYSDFQNIYPHSSERSTAEPRLVEGCILPRTDYIDDDDKGLKPPEKNNPAEVLITRNSKGQEKSSCKIGIIKYLRSNNYSEEIIQESLIRTESSLEPISNVLKYVETICIQIQSQNSKKPQFKQKENPWTPRQSKFQRKQFFPKEDMNPSKKPSTTSREKILEEDTSAHPFQTWPSRLKNNKQQLIS